MTYEETIEYLYNQLPVFQRVGGIAYKEGLDNSLALDAYFDHPHTKYKTIHVGGTNGKGSTSHLLAAILQQAGYKVGLYTSPHLVDFRERIRVDGKKIDKQYVVNFVEKHKNSYEAIHPSFFELTMMMAFCYFEEMNVDIAVIEVGLGGRLDSTNIIMPDLSIITNISFDHMQLLGDTLEKIASEKAGIIKEDIPIVIGEAEGSVKKVFEDKANGVGAPIFFAQDDKFITSYEFNREYLLLENDLYPNLKDELCGYAQVKNAATVFCAINVLKNRGYTIPKAAVYNGFANVCELTGLMGRWQKIQEKPTIICDTGHNEGGIRYIVQQLKNETYECLHIVFGMVNDKDISTVLSLLPENAIYYFTRASVQRSLNENELKAKAEKMSLHGKSYASVEDAISAAKSNASEKDVIFIGGSNFVVADALSYFHKRN